MARPRKSAPEAETASPRKANPELGAKLKAIVAERTKAEQRYEAQQQVLRDLDRDGERGTDAYSAELAKLNTIRDEIGRISNEHVDISNAFSYASGGVVHRPPPTA